MDEIIYEYDIRYAHDATPPTTSLLVRRGLNMFLSIEKEERNGEGSHQLHEEWILMEDAGIPESIIREWHEAGLLSTSLIGSPIRDDAEPFTLLSVFNMAWFYILDDLFRLGLSVDFMAKVADDALNDMVGWLEHDTQEYPLFPLLEVYLWLAVKHQVPTLFLVFETGRTEFFSFDEYVALWDIYKQSPPNHFIISLNQIGQKLLDNGFLDEYDPTPTYSPVVPVSDEEMQMIRTFRTSNDQSTPTYPPVVRLSDEEMQVIRTLRANNYRKLTIHTRKGKLESIEGEETIPVSKETPIVNLLNDTPFQNLQLKTSNGRLVNITRTVKTKLSSSTDEEHRE